jgi:four helix bundle protein
LSEALGEATETQAWLDHATDCGYIDEATVRELNASWQSVGAMIYRMMECSAQFCPVVDRRRDKPV